MTREYRALWDLPDPCSLQALRGLMPAGSKLLAHLAVEGAGFLAARFEAGQRSVVYLARERVLLVYGTELAEGVRLAPSLFAMVPKDTRSPESLIEIDLLGATVDDWTVWFHRDRNAAQSAVSFLLPKGPDSRFLVTGLGPGAWDVWHDGWLEEKPLRVAPEAGAAYWRGARGSYFLRRQTGQ